MLAEEVAENYPREFKTLDKDLKANLKQKVCQNCKEPLKDQDIDYLVANKILWWCRMCIKERKRW